jgi:hypothetical protein
LSFKIFSQNCYFVYLHLTVLAHNHGTEKEFCPMTQRSIGNEDMTKKIGGEPLRFDLGEGYHVKFVDYGIAGVMISLHRPDWQSHDNEAAAMLPREAGESLLHWLERTVGRAAMALPVQTQAVLKGLLAKDGIKKLLPKADRNILKDSVRILEELDQIDEPDASFNIRSRVQRALER